MEVATEQLRALLSACTAVSRASSASADPLDAADACVGLAPERLSFWDALCGDSAPVESLSLAADMGILLASTNVPTAKIVSLLRVLVTHPSLHSAGLLRLAQLTFRGLKLTKRWDALSDVSTQLLDAVYDKIQAVDTRERALRFYIEILVGFQHSAELYELNVPKIAALAELLSADEEQNKELVHPLLVACSALAHCHRGYEAEAMTLWRALRAAFGRRVARPTAAEAERLLRSCAWVLPAEKMNEMLPSVEGKWMMDEFISDQHASGGPQNAGSVLLKKTTNCFAHEVTAIIDHPKLKAKLELKGSLFQQMPEMQVLLSHPDEIEAGEWEFEGHWRQLHDETRAVNSVAPMAPVTAPTWDCRACTMNNEASATKCATCGTERPSDVEIPTTANESKGTNPAPFSAVFNSDLSFMRMKWSRGEKQGVWLARKESIDTTFDLSVPLAAVNNAMMDSTSLSAHVFSPKGNPAHTLVLERNVLSTSDHTEFTVQAWIRPEHSPSSNKAQIVLANGHDFELLLSSNGHLVWQIAGGRYSITSRDAVQLGVFCHVTLSFAQDRVVLLIDGSVAGEATRAALLDEAGPAAPGVSLFSIGGSFESCDSSVSGDAPSCFYGQILDLRIWSTLLTNIKEWSIWSALTGREGHLLGYYPLVGDSERLLLDLSTHQNHACVFEGYQSAEAFYDAQVLSVGTFSPTTPTESIPVKSLFAVSLGKEFFGSGKFCLPDDGSNGLQIHCADAGAALWRQNAVSIAGGFRSTVSLASSRLTANDAQSSPETVVFALCEASFWDLVPLLAEASAISSGSSDRPTDSRLCQFEGSAMLARITSNVVAPGIRMYELGLHIWSKKGGATLSRVFRIAGGPSAATSNVQIKYELPGRVISVEIGGVGVVFEVAVDLELALRIERGSPVRTGLVFPPSKPDQSPTWLMNWTFESFDANLRDQEYDSILGNVYAPLQLKRPDGDTGGDSNTVVCTRMSTDGSAVLQESYGCQTCNVVHGSRICRACAVVCHEGHELVAMGVTTTACACHVRGTGLCRCSTPVLISDFPLLSQPVNAPLWGCTKCTVINSVQLKQCSVCGNNAPEANAGFSTGPLSSSRALALVEQPQPAEDWSCEACTMLNNSTATKCSVCETPRPSQAESEVARPNQSDNGLTTLYHAAEDAVKKSQSGWESQAIVPNSTSPWICSACTMQNQALDTTCHMCSTVRTIPIANPVEHPEVVMALPTSKGDATESIPTSMDIDGNDVTASTVAPSSPVGLPTSKLKNVKYLDEYKRTAAQAYSHLLDIGGMKDSVWETTAGKMHIDIGKSFVGEYVRGTYLEKDGKLSGLVRLTEDGAWKLDGRFKKVTQSQSNACTLYWDKAASRFDGKWFRGDGSGDWKCLASAYVSDFCGLAPTDPVKNANVLQPFYSGMVNMKQNLTNVCYQNSFIQTLYMTQDFRRLILSCDAEHYSAPYADNGTVSEGNIVSTIQGLFAHMTASQRPFFATHALQRCLPAEFKNGRQQDTSDFAHFLIDSLSQQLSQHKETADDIHSIFGGHQATILACKTCGKRSVNHEYFWELLLNMIDLRYTPITKITAVSGSSMDIRTPDGFERLNTDLNKDRTGAPYVYLCVKRCPERATMVTMMEDTNEESMPITELMVKVALSTDPKPSMQGFERVELDLNVGGGATSGGKKQVYLFYRREPNGSPITDLQVVYNTEAIPDGFKQIQVDINQGDGSKVFLCYRCDMPITDLKIVNSGIPGYRMVDHLLNVSHEDALKQYLALKVGGHDPCLTGLKLVDGSNVAKYQEEGWQSIGSPFSFTQLPEPTLNEDPFVPPQLMVRRGHGNPIFAIDVFRAPRQVPKYNDYEVIKLVQTGDSPTDTVLQLKGDWMGNEDTERGRKAVRVKSVSEPISNALLVKGALDDKGELSCVATRVSTWSGLIGTPNSSADGAMSAGNASNTGSSPVYRVSGYWKSSKVLSAQLFDVELRPALNGMSCAPDDAVIDLSQNNPSLYAINGTIGDGRGKPIAIHGVQRSRKVKIKWPISKILVLRGDERVPEGVQVIRETCSCRSGNLLAQTASPHTLYLAVMREEAPNSGYISDICVIYGEIDAVPENYTCIQTTPAGHSANLNDGTSGVPVFICYRHSGSVDEGVTSSSGSTPKVLMNLALMWTSGAQPDSLPTGFTKIQHTPLGMEANLNQGTSGVAIHICYSKFAEKDVVQPIENMINGEYEITSAPLPAFGRFLSLSVVEELEEARAVEANFGTVLHAQLPGAMSGVLFTIKHQQPNESKCRRMVGAWRVESPMGGLGVSSMTDYLPSSFPFELTLNEAGTELDGWWSAAEGSASSPSKPGLSVVTSAGSGAASSNAAATSTAVGGKWKLVKDSYVHIAFKKDYSTEWRDGRLVFSERVWQHDIASMLSRFVATRTLGGDNALSCSACQRKTESRTHTVIFDPPEHLIITLKRMYYDWGQQKARKCLHDVRFPALLTLPSLTADEELAVYESANVDVARTRQRNRSRNYGLYGVLVHSGLTANSGHYYSFCRESDESTRQLHLEDSPLSPWIKFNDMKVERSDWKEINRLVTSTVSDTVYLLLYKKLSYDPPCTETDTELGEGATTDGGSDDEEAMLLAKAMALSMSAAKQNQQRRAEDEESKGESEAGTDIVERETLSTNLTTKALLKKVEEENMVFLRESLTATSSALHADDLHTLLVLRHSLPLHLRSLLDEIC